MREILFSCRPLPRRIDAAKDAGHKILCYLPAFHRAGSRSRRTLNSPDSRETDVNTPDKCTMNRRHGTSVWVVAVIICIGLTVAGLPIGAAANPSEASGSYEEGIAALRRRDADSAMDAFTRAIETDPTVAGPHYRLGLLFGGRSLWLPAIQSLRTAVELDPSHADAHCELGEAYLIGTVEASRALVPLRRAIELEPNHPRAWRLLGLAHLRLHELDEAAGNLGQAVESASAGGAGGPPADVQQRGI